MSRPDVVTYRGAVYRRYPHARALSDRLYYRATTGERAYLHRVVYATVHGPIPPGHRVIHRDGDPGNNAPPNLVAVPATPPPARRTKAQRVAAARANLLTDPRTVSCQWCPATFTATHPRARYCSTRCRVAAHRAAAAAPTATE